jgi:hypothetical protein
MSEESEIVEAVKDCQTSDVLAQSIMRKLARKAGPTSFCGTGEYEGQWLLWVGSLPLTEDELKYLLPH